MQASRRNLIVGSASFAGLAAIAFAGKSQAQSNPTASPDSSTVAVVQRYYQAYATSDRDQIRSFFAPEITWTIPGHHPLAGTKRGADEVLAFFDQLAKAKFQAEVLFLGGNDRYVVDVHRGWSNIDGTAAVNVDQLWALLFRIEGDRIVEAINFPGDQHAADAFFWSAYPLKPLPDRLA